MQGSELCVDYRNVYMCLIKLAQTVKLVLAFLFVFNHLTQSYTTKPDTLFLIKDTSFTLQLCFTVYAPLLSADIHCYKTEKKKLQINQSIYKFND